MFEPTTTENQTSENQHPDGDAEWRPSTSVDDLVAAARRGEQRAWDALVERFRPLVRAVASRYRLCGVDVDDVDQTVWLRLIENLGRIREPRALPRWLATTAGNESLRVARSHRRTLLMDPTDDTVHQLETPQPVELDANLLRREVSDAVRRGLAELPAAQRELLTLLADERLLTYREISRILAIPVGSIGPSRARGLARLRATAAVREYRSSWEEHRESA